MGTRNLTCVVHDGEYKIAQYGQWDGYLEGAGMTIFEFLQETDIEEFTEKIKQVAAYTDEELKEISSQFGDGSGWLTIDEAEKYNEAYPNLTRNTGCKILHLVRDSEDPVNVSLHLNFAKDSLFCEWAYVIDLDKGMFEIYQGFNQSPLEEGERFYSEDPPENAVGDEAYYPVKHLISFDLKKLPPTSETFLQLAKEAVGEPEE